MAYNLWSFEDSSASENEPSVLVNLEWTEFSPGWTTVCPAWTSACPGWTEFSPTSDKKFWKLKIFSMPKIQVIFTINECKIIFSKFLFFDG